MPCACGADDAHHLDQRHDEDERAEALSKADDEQGHEQDRRNGELHLDEAGYDVVEDAAIVGGGETDEPAGECRDEAGSQCRQDRGASAHHHPAEEVAAELIGAESVVAARWLQRNIEHPEGVIRDQQRRQQGNTEVSHDEQQAEDRERPPGQPEQHVPHEPLVRGSRARMARSARRLSPTTTAADSRAMAWMTWTSRCDTARTSSWPSPG